jgi:hypothetical protein
MSTDDGKKIQSAIKAVCQMHSDVSKLLLDFDGLAPWPSESVFGNTATRDLTAQARTPYWMSEGVFRYLSNKAEPSLVEAITVCFIDPKLVEPLLLLGRIRYAVGEDGTIAGRCEPWDLWNLHFLWNKDWQERVPKDCSAPDQSRIISARVIAAPLYSIGSLSEVGDLLTRMRNCGASV